MTNARVTYITPNRVSSGTAGTAALSPEARRAFAHMQRLQAGDRLHGFNTLALAKVLRVGEHTARRVLNELADADVYRWARNNHPGTGWAYTREVTATPGRFTRPLPRQAPKTAGRAHRVAPDGPCGQPVSPPADQSADKPTQRVHPVVPRSRVIHRVDRPIKRNVKDLSKTPPTPHRGKTPGGDGSAPADPAHLHQAMAIADGLGMPELVADLAAALGAGWAVGDLLEALCGDTGSARSVRAVVRHRLVTLPRPGRPVIRDPRLRDPRDLRDLPRGRALPSPAHVPRCVTHPGQDAATCGGCRADALAVA